MTVIREIRPEEIPVLEDTMELSELQIDCARKQKKGLHFILASIVIWGLLLGIHLTHLTIGQKILITFCCSVVLFPMAWGFSRMLGIDFEGKGNPLTKAGISSVSSKS